MYARQTGGARRAARARRDEAPFRSSPAPEDELPGARGAQGVASGEHEGLDWVRCTVKPLIINWASPALRGVDASAPLFPERSPWRIIAVATGSQDDLNLRCTEVEPQRMAASLPEPTSDLSGVGEPASVSASRRRVARQGLVSVNGGAMRLAKRPGKIRGSVSCSARRRATSKLHGM